MHRVQQARPLMFTCFERLPFDIRSCVWGFAAFLPRDIDIWAQYFGVFTYSADFENGLKVFRYVTTQAPPAILHANKEARAIGLKYYSLEFDSLYCVPGRYNLRLEIPPKTFVNRGCDRICLLGSFDGLSFPCVFDPRPKKHTEQNGPRCLDGPIRIAINVVTAFLSFMPDEGEFLEALAPYEEVFLYYLEEDDYPQLPQHGHRVALDFIPLDISSKGDRGLCANLKKRLDILQSNFEESGGVSNHKSRLGLGDEMFACSKCLRPNVNWVTLVFNGQKLGLY